ncbi:MAG: arylmalonate decarboxylase [Pseudomonadota bacterium]
MDLTNVFDDGRHHRAKIGFVLLATEQTIEEDMFRLCPPGVGLHFTRAAMPDSITIDTFLANAADLAPAAERLLPDGSLDVIAYACTSGSLVIGEDRVMAELSKGAPDATPTTLITGVLAALGAFDAKKVAVATPYLDEINMREADYLEAAGFEVTNIRGLQIEKDSDIIRVRPDFIADFARATDTPDSDALFISCGALRTIDMVDQLEQELGKPVICSNQAMMWDVLRKSGIQDSIPGYGRLLREF